ncbi:MAG: carbohydrate binding family 9 domain-containing protein, partial [Vicinamibacterales bacterium]|nr:carbohydrate binding family 9 domain-containing protein [Vicinamibacterales bacterium]
MRATRVTEPIKIDGNLDERAYTDILPIDEWFQQEPHEGAAATERTEAWILFDDRNIYISARCWDSHPEREVANEMRRDSNNIIQNESFTIIFDTFHDRRNGVFFQTNALGALRDAMSTDESNQNTDWNTIWDVRTQRSDQGWSVEFVIPFKSLRYGPGREQTWGINLRRIIGWKSEWVFLSTPPAYLGQPSILAVSKAATLVGLEVPESRKLLEIKPYGIAGIRTDLGTRDPFINKRDHDFGGDAKYGITKSLTLDLTYNTDFAQVEDDTQQVNLTRFNLQYPERREFFLEGQGLFAFGNARLGGGGGGSSNTPVLFFSRRIGLNNGRPVPIAGGGRLTGRIGDYSIGMLNIQSENDVPSASKATNFSVLRLKRNILRRSNVGVLYTRRIETETGGAPPGETFGFDGLYSLSTSLNVNGYYARTKTAALNGGDDHSHLLSFDYNADRYGLQVQNLAVGPTFIPQVGFLRRTDFKRNFAQARFSPRPSRDHWKAIRRFVYSANVEYIENNQGRLEFREQEGL